MASVAGSRRVSDVPCPCTVFNSIEPPRPRTRARTASMPTPRPELITDLRAVEKPGVQ